MDDHQHALNLYGATTSSEEASQPQEPQNTDSFPEYLIGAGSPSIQEKVEVSPREQSDNPFDNPPEEPSDELYDTVSGFFDDVVSADGVTGSEVAQAVEGLADEHGLRGEILHEAMEGDYDLSGTVEDWDRERNNRPHSEIEWTKSAWNYILHHEPKGQQWKQFLTQSGLIRNPSVFFLPLKQARNS